MSGGLSRYFRESRTLPVSLVFVLPLLALYEMGILIFRSRIENHAGLIVKRMVAWFGVDAPLFVTGAITVAFAVALLVKERRFGGSFGMYGVMFLEAGLYGALLGPIVATLSSRLLALDALALHASGVADGALRVVLSVGAGVWEELVFRMFFLGGTIWLFVVVFRGNRVIFTAMALRLSSVSFTLLHHVGAMAEPIEPGRVLFRTLAGLALGAIYLWRGLGICVYSHALYNVGLLITTSIGETP